MSRKRTIKTLACAAILPLSATAADVAKPNVLFIPVDDLKPLLNCYGESHIKTPNIDRLAARGTLFMNAQCQQAICGPTRASLMTGMYPDKTKVYDLKTKMRDVNPNILTIPQYFRQNVYETTGLGKTYDSRCVDNQLDEPSWSIPYGGKSHKLLYNKKTGGPTGGYQLAANKKASKEASQAARQKKFKNKNEEKKYIVANFPNSRSSTECADVPDDAYNDGAFANTAVKLMEKLAKADKPFFLSVGFQKPHLPFVAPKKYWDMYDRNEIKIHPYQKAPKNGPLFALQPGWELRSYTDIPPKGPVPEAKQKELIHGYYACVSYTDAQVGKLLDKLDELKVADNTIICLWGDHGWHLGDHAMWCKHSNYEQAARVPMILAGPKQKKKGTKSDSLVGFVDIFPTLCDMAGLKVPSHLQGKSLTSILDDPTKTVKVGEVSQYPRRSSGKPVMGYSLRVKQYRYTAWYVNKNNTLGDIVATELYDYKNDPMETVNQAANPEMKSKVEELQAILSKRLEEIRR